MNYTDPRWQKKRLEILSRDNWKCVACGDGDSTLHVHHIDYHGELWETPSELLQTLCESCHSAFGPHTCGGPYYAWVPDDENGEGLVLSMIFRHCPQCGNANDASHSGSVIFECGHFDWTAGDKWSWCAQTSINGLPAYYALAPNVELRGGPAASSPERPA